MCQYSGCLGVQKGKKRSIELRNPLPPIIPQVVAGFYGRENAHPRPSGILMKFLPLPSAISGRGISLFFAVRALIPSAGSRLYSSSSMNRGKQAGRRGCARHSFPRMQITSVYYFANAKGKEEEEASSIWKIMKRYFDRARAYISSVSSKLLEKPASFSDTVRKHG